VILAHGCRQEKPEGLRSIVCTLAMNMEDYGMDLDEKIYELLPMAYISAGLLTLLLMDSRLKILPALLLVGAGALVWIWRRNARRSVRQQFKNGPSKVRRVTLG
jgi:hypothetical protein